ncbi:MAG: uracil-DNA glycosylase [Candidatus Harrisonbacteria bacterium]|nr:uracil-DNA glycosylase [Candidatus Harrisonbacteria bacterium]
MNKETELKKIESEMTGDKSLSLSTNLVFGEGSPDCAVMFIGEAPGEQEDIQKRPFVGRGGQLLNKMIEKIGWKREDVYITNIVKRRPPNNRDPLPEEIATYQPYLQKQIEIINPKIIATLGRFSMAYFNPNLKISRDHGKVFRMNGRLFVPFYHPAAVLRNPNLISEYEAEFKKLPKILEKFDELLREVPVEAFQKKEAPQSKLF